VSRWLGKPSARMMADGRLRSADMLEIMTPNLSLNADARRRAFARASVAG
jgi:hypothetical protein